MHIQNDWLHILINFYDHVIISSSDNEYHVVDVNLVAIGIKTAARVVYADENDCLQHTELFHPFESIASNLSGFSFKVFNNCKFKPRVEIKFSPSKILQKHNVFGPKSGFHAVCEVLTSLHLLYPKLIQYLDISNAEILAIDYTASARLKSKTELKQVQNFLRNVSNKSLRKSNKSSSYASTQYWGSENSIRINRKCYDKFEELMNEINELKKKAGRGDLQAIDSLKFLDCESLIEFAKYLLRFEARLKKQWLYENGIPLNLWQFFAFERDNPMLGIELWQKAFSPLFEGFENMSMKIYNDDEILNKISIVHDKITRTGRLSKVKSMNLFNFYLSLRTLGYDKVKEITSNSKFYENVKDILDCNFCSKFELQNLKQIDEKNVVPFLKLIEIDFSNQLPVDYVEPVSRHAHIYKHLIPNFSKAS
ncbi:TPA: hypothetical protein PEV06_000503 [Acinetobacter baumannii]|uniref:phage/plasmid replication protein, II/X family n=1 Tax=Acinetobacter baumannii TaxID=470 RepID=UPI001FD6FEBE|nr:phage/plasmid replication protein, II/X family [Acinetobacter baumannii]MDC5063920.1 phage/plasmid replication protein, II/X family [Acinetobacter baumannii]HCH8075453.1 hypothetical protein [Acinetobacter baumannii]HDF7033801.1 hypothetical protein [Acinetobacter baumannii]